MSTDGNAASSQLKSFISGAAGGISLVLVGQPFDFVKVKVQTSNEYKGAIDCIRKTVARDGIKGLYKGMLAPLIGITPLYSVCFWGYDLGQQLIRLGMGKATGEKLSIAELSVAGGFSALPATALMAPMERVKCLLQTQTVDPVTGKKQYTGAIDVVRQLYKQGGMRSIYVGTGATLLRDIPGSVAYFGGYELLKKALTPPGKRPEDLSPLTVLFAGGMAGVFNWMVAIPADVIKSRLQTAAPGTYSGTMDCLSQLLKKEGPGALFRGVGPVMLRAFPANAACFLGVEVSRNFLNRVL